MGTPIYERERKNTMLKQREFPSKRLLSVKDASLYLGRSVPAIRELIWAGTLPCVRIGKRIHLDIYDLEKVIEQHRVTYNL